MALLKPDVSEERLVSLLVEYYSRSNGFRIYREVAFLNKRIDLVLVNRRNDEIWAIEAKLSRWKKALEQAKATLLGADRAYVALPKRKMNRLGHYEDIMRDAGVGFLAVALDCELPLVEEIMSPDRRLRKNPIRERELRSSIESGLYLRAEK